MVKLRDRYSVGALGLYLALSLLFFGRGLIGHFSTFHIGEGADPPLMMWFLVWWPHAIAIGLNPIITHAFWAPVGLNLTWSTSIPLVSLLATPLTASLGPVATLNILCLLSLPFSAWCAFVLCRYVSGNYWTSMLGGYIFGFCPTLLGQLLFGRLHAVWVFPVPLAVYLLVRRFRGEITARRFTILLSLVLVIEFLISPEIFVTMAVFLGTALTLAWWLNTGRLRESLVGIIVAVGCGYIAALVAMSPYLYYAFFSYRPYADPIWNNRMVWADLVNFFIPSPVNEFGRLRWFEAVSAFFNAGVPSEEVAYLSLPLMVIATLYARRHWREPVSRLLAGSLVIILVCSLGPFLVVRGHQTKIALPWIVIRTAVPVLKSAATVRFGLYAFLVLAIITSLWLATAEIKPYLKFAIGGAVLLFLLPNLSAAYWIQPAQDPAFFRTGLYRNYLREGETVFILPFWPRNDAMLWQAETHLYFRMAGGPGPWPVTIRNWPIVEAFMRQTYVPNAPEWFKAYMVDHGVSTIIVADSSLPVWQPVLSALDFPVTRVGGVSLYKIPPHSEGDATPAFAALRERFDKERFETLLTRANQYLARGGNPDNLTAANASALGVIPADSLIGISEAPVELRNPEANWSPLTRLRYGVWLFVDDENRIVVGEWAWYPVAKELLGKYSTVAGETVLLPKDWKKRILKEPDFDVLVVMAFNREQLAKAAAIARPSAATRFIAPPGLVETRSISSVGTSRTSVR
jgi:hypothetical protein